MNHPHVRLIRNGKYGNVLVYINSSFAGMVINNVARPSYVLGNYSAMIDDKQLSVDSLKAGIEALVFEFCILDSVDIL